MNQAEIPCPKCNKQNPAAIVYDFVTHGSPEVEDRNIVYGGCTYYGYDYECQKCFYQWAEDKPQNGEYNERKAMTEVGEYKNGEMHGVWTTRTRLGVKYFDRTFNMGRLEGKVVMYDEEGLKYDEHFDGLDDDADDIKICYNKKGYVDKIYLGDGKRIEGDEVKNYIITETPKGFQLSPAL